MDPTELLALIRPVFEARPALDLSQVLPALYSATPELLLAAAPDSTSTQLYLPSELAVALADLKFRLGSNDKASFQYNPFEGIGKSIFGNRAATKLAGIQAVWSVYAWGPSVPGQGDGITWGNDLNRPAPDAALEVETPAGQLPLPPITGTFVDIAGGPGSWTQYLQFLDPQAWGYGLTLKRPGWDWDVDKYRLDLTRFQIDYGPAQDGDITKPVNFEAMMAKILAEQPAGLDLAVADGGRGASTEAEYAEEEVRHQRLIMAEVLIGIGVLRIGGQLVVKVFDLWTPFSADLIYLVAQAFDRITLYKPISSRPSNSEKYLLGFGRRDWDAVATGLQILRQRLQSATPIARQSRLLDVELPVDFQNWLTGLNERMAVRQQEYLQYQVGRGTANQPRYDVLRIFQLWKLPVPDTEILRRKTTPARFSLDPVVAPAGVQIRWGTESVDLAQLRSLLDARGWLAAGLTRPRELPFVDVSQWRLADLLDRLVQVLTEVKFDFPYRARFRTPEQVVQSYQRLLNYQPELETVAGAYPLKEVRAGAEFALPVNFQEPGSDQRSYYLMPDSPWSYREMDWVVDYFTESSRMRGNRSFSSISPHDAWYRYGQYLRQGLEYVLTHNSELSLAGLRDALYLTAGVDECKHEKSSFLRVLFRFLGLGPGDRCFDACAGWGDRLLAATSLGASYLGVDPNQNSQAGFRAMAELVARWGPGSPAAEVLPLSMPLPDFEHKIGAGRYRLVTISPPAFTGERYSDDPGQSTLRFSSNNKQRWLQEFLFPTLEQCWLALQPGGYFVVQSIMIEDIAPYLVQRSDLFFCGPISVGFPSRNKPLWVFQKLNSDLRLTARQVNQQRIYRQAGHDYLVEYHRLLAAGQQLLAENPFAETGLAESSNNFPYYYRILFPPKVMFRHLRATQPSATPDLVTRRWPEDYKVCDFISCHFTEEARMLCNNYGQPSPWTFWQSLGPAEQERRLARGIEAANTQLYKQYICNIFNPSFGLRLILDTVGPGATILDPSAGWGDRLIAALASGAKAYRGIDPNPDLEAAYPRIVEVLGPEVAPDLDVATLKQRFQVFTGYFEEVSMPEGRFDLALTSPPYYVLEEYRGAAQGLTYEQWLQQVYQPYLTNMYRAVKPGGWLILYVEDFSLAGRTYQFRTETVRIVDALGGLRQSDYGLIVSTGVATSDVPRYAVRWRKPGGVATPVGIPPARLAGYIGSVAKIFRKAGLSAAGVTSREPALGRQLAGLVSGQLTPEVIMTQMAGWMPASGWRLAATTRAAERIDLISALVREAGLQPHSLLDVGAGRRAEISLAAKAAFGLGADHIYVVEPKLEGSHPEFKVIDYVPGTLQLPLPDASIDLILLIVVLHHIEPEARQVLLRELARILKPSGLLVLREHDDTGHPDFRAFIELVHLAWYVVENEAPDPLYLMSRTQTQQLLATAGMVPVGYRDYPGHNPQRLYTESYRRVASSGGAGGGR